MMPWPWRARVRHPRPVPIERGIEQRALMEALRGKTRMTVKNENIAQARELLNVIDDFGHIIELIAVGIADADYVGPLGQIGAIIREKSAEAEALLREGISQPEHVKCAD
jgi:hypothetical protein